MTDPPNAADGHPARRQQIWCAVSDQPVHAGLARVSLAAARRVFDGAALVAQQLGRSDAVARLEAARLGAPSLIRLLRWLVAAGPACLVRVDNAKEVLRRCPKTAGQQLGLLRVLVGDMRAARQGFCCRPQAWVGRRRSSGARAISGVCCPARRDATEGQRDGPRGPRINVSRSIGGAIWRLPAVYLQTRGEVAKRLKAAVC